MRRLTNRRQEVVEPGFAPVRQPRSGRPVGRAPRRSPADPAGFVEIVHGALWCTLSTVVRQAGRARVVHPVWRVGAAGPSAGCAPGRAPKAAHLAAVPYASCSYRDAPHDVAVAGCRAEWDPDPGSSRHVFGEAGADRPASTRRRCSPAGSTP